VKGIVDVSGSATGVLVVKGGLEGCTALIYVVVSIGFVGVVCSGIEVVIILVVLLDNVGVDVAMMIFGVVGRLRSGVLETTYSISRSRHFWPEVASKSSR